MRNRHAYFVPLLVLVVGLLRALPVGAAEKTFPAGSWIIPMDTVYQPEADQGLFEAYGLVWELLSNGVTIYWIVDPDKVTPSDVDFSKASGFPASGSFKPRIK